MKVAWSHGLVSRSILVVSVLAPMITAGVLTSLLLLLRASNCHYSDQLLL